MPSAASSSSPTSTSRSSSPSGVSDNNYGRYKDPVLDDLYIKQARAVDPEERQRHLRAFEKRLLDEEAHYIYTLQWHRIVPHERQGAGLDDHAVALPEPAARRRLARRVTRRWRDEAMTRAAGTDRSSTQMTPDCPARRATSMCPDPSPVPRGTCSYAARLRKSMRESAILVGPANFVGAEVADHFTATRARSARPRPRVRFEISPLAGVDRIANAERDHSILRRAPRPRARV